MQIVVLCINLKVFELKGKSLRIYFLQFPLALTLVFRPSLFFFIWFYLCFIFTFDLIIAIILHLCWSCQGWLHFCPYERLRSLLFYVNTFWYSMRVNGVCCLFLNNWRVSTKIYNFLKELKVNKIYLGRSKESKKWKNKNKNMKIKKEVLGNMQIS